MTSDNDDMSEMDELQRSDADIEALLAGDQPSGDAAVDAALAALRDLGRHDPPAPSAELRQVLGAGLAAVPTPGRTSPKGRHIATGSATLAGLILASATAAAAIGVHHVATSPPEPRPTPRVTHATPATPRPASTTHTPEPPTGPTVGPSGHGVEHADHPSSPGSGDDADEQVTGGHDDAKPSARPTPSSTDDDPGDDGDSGGDGDSDHHGGDSSGGGSGSGSDGGSGGGSGGDD